MPTLLHSIPKSTASISALILWVSLPRAMRRINAGRRRGCFINEWPRSVKDTTGSVGWAFSASRRGCLRCRRQSTGDASACSWCRKLPISAKWKMNGFFQAFLQTPACLQCSQSRATMWTEERQCLKLTYSFVRKGSRLSLHQSLYCNWFHGNYKSTSFLLFSSSHYHGEFQIPCL